MLPNFIIIGAQKSASTLLHQCLNEHPDVFIPARELPFFQDPDYFQNDLKTFELSFESGRGKKRVGMRRAEYLYKLECPPRIRQHIPSAKLIVILRHPVERAVSAYYHYARSGFAPIKHINEGLGELIKGQHLEQYPRAAEIIEYGFYYKHLSHYLDYFDRSQLLVLFYDDLIKKPEALFSQVFNFLELAEIYRPQSLDSRPQAGVYSVLRLKLLSLRNPLLYNYSSDQDRLSLKEKIGPVGSLVVKIINMIDSKILSKMLGNPKPTLSGELREILISTYHDDIIQLEKLLGCNLSCWQAFQRN